MTSRTALVVDDSRSARYAMRKLLEGLGYTVDTAESAQDAFVYLERRRPGVVFIDHQMPGADGLDVLRALKADRDSADVPVVICSSSDDAAFQQNARDAGAIAVLPKPPDRDQLDALLRRLKGTPEPVSGQRRAPSLGLPAYEPPAASPKPPPSSPRDTSPGPDALLARLDRLERDIAALRTQLDDRDKRDDVTALVPALLRELEGPVQSRARRAAAQVMQRIGERLVQEARALAAPPRGDDDTDD